MFRSLALAFILAFSLACIRHTKRPGEKIVSVTKTVGYDQFGNKTPGVTWCTISYGDHGTREWTTIKLDAECDERHVPK